MTTTVESPDVISTDILRQKIVIFICCHTPTKSNPFKFLYMKTIVFFSLLLLHFVTLNAQTKVRQGGGTFSNNVLVTIDGNKVRQGDGTASWNTILYTIDDTKIRQGDGAFSSNTVVLTIDGNKVRQGDGTASWNTVLYTIDDNKIRQGDGTFPSNTVLFTLNDNKISQGDSTSSASSKVVYTIEGEISIKILACILSLGF